MSKRGGNWAFPFGLLWKHSTKAPTPKNHTRPVAEVTAFTFPLVLRIVFSQGTWLCPLAVPFLTFFLGTGFPY